MTDKTPPPTTLYLIRHGEPAAEFKTCYYGDNDVPLSEKGMAQSREVAQRLASVPFDAVYSSDLERAGYLAERIAETRDLPVRRLAVFRERNHGVLQGLTIDQLERDHTEWFHKWKADRVFCRVPEAENFEDVQARVIPALMELVAAFAGRRVALVCHAGPIRAMLAHAIGLPLEHIFRLGVDYVGIHVIEYSDGHPPRLKLLNG